VFVVVVEKGGKEEGGVFWGGSGGVEFL